MCSIRPGGGTDHQPPTKPWYGVCLELVLALMLHIGLLALMLLCQAGSTGQLLLERDLA